MKKRIKNILFLFFIFWSFFFNAQILNAKTLPPGTGIADVPANILLMLDTSGSMGWSIGTIDAILKYPTGVDVDSSGNIYVLEYYSSSPDTLYNVPVRNKIVSQVKFVI